MTLLLTLVLVTLVLFAVFLGGTLVAQGYLYQAPVDRLPLRALAGGLVAALFLTFWVWLDKRSPRKYDTFFEFAPYETKTFDEFDAIRWTSADGSKFRVDASGNKVESSVKFKRGVGAKANTFFEEPGGAEFKLNAVNKTGESYMTAALKLKPEPNENQIRFGAKLAPDKRSYAQGVEGRRFDEENGSRYVQADQLGVMYVTSTSTVVLALLLNLLHFVMWFVVFWVGLHFTRGHAFVLAASFGLLTMILLMPLLFKPNRTPPPPEAPKAARVEQGAPLGKRGLGQGEWGA